jgi:hypothetical protein
MLQLFTVFKVSLILGIIGALILGLATSPALGQSDRVIVKKNPGNCSHGGNQPADPTEMNSILIPSARASSSSGFLLQTIHMMKDTFRCLSSESTNPTLIDYTLFTEIFSSETGPAFFPERTIFAVTRCERTLEGENLSCESSPVPNEKINLTRCFEYFVSPFSIKMNTVLVNSSGKSIPKSITTEQFSYSCSTQGQESEIRLKDLNLFTSAIGNLNSTSMNFMATTYIKDPLVAKIISCNVSSTG